MSFKPFVIEKTNYRIPRFKQRIKEELSQLLPSCLADPRMHEVELLTITDVQLSVDLKYADVSFSLMAQGELAEQTEKILNQASEFIRKKIMKRIDSKTTPHLNFKYDRGLDNTSEVSNLLKQISQN